MFDNEIVVFRFDSVLDGVRAVFLSCLERNPRSCRQYYCATAAQLVSSRQGIGIACSFQAWL